MAKKTTSDVDSTILNIYVDKESSLNLIRTNDETMLTNALRDSIEDDIQKDQSRTLTRSFLKAMFQLSRQSVSYARIFADLARSVQNKNSNTKPIGLPVAFKEDQGA